LLRFLHFSIFGRRNVDEGRDNVLASQSDCRHWGLLEIFTHYGAIRAAHKLLTPLLKPVLGLPGRSGLALITDLQSTGAGLINNYFAIGSALFVSLSIPVLIPRIAIQNLLPNVVMAYVIAEMLNLPGIMGFIGKVFAPHSDNTWAVCWVCPTCRRSTGHCRW
jgi:nucleoside recognition membrane protein YjiH